MPIVLLLMLNSMSYGDDLPKALQPLKDADKVTFYSIDGTDDRPKKEEDKKDDAEKFHGYRVLGKIELKDAATRQKVVAALREGLEPDSKDFARCFWPRHAFRAEKGGVVTDYVICYQCHWFKVFTGDKVQDIVTNSKPVEMLNKMLKDAGIPVAP